MHSSENVAGQIPVTYVRDNMYNTLEPLQGLEPRRTESADLIDDTACG